jgi:hypothetical protein
VKALSSITGARWLATALAAVALMALPNSAWADGTKKSEPAARTPTSDELAERAFKAYEEGDFAGAIGTYLQAFEVSGDSRILYNVGAIYDKKLHDVALAQSYYQRYLFSSVTEPELVKKATARLAELKASEKPPEPASVEAKPAKPQAAPVPTKTIALTLAAAGALALIVGTGFGVSAISKSDDLKTKCPNDVCPNDEGPQLRDEAASAATVSTILFVSGLALVGAGAAMYFVRPPNEKGAALRVRPAMSPQHAGLFLGGRF